MASTNQMEKLNDNVDQINKFLTSSLDATIESFQDKVVNKFDQLLDMVKEISKSSGGGGDKKAGGKGDDKGKGKKTDNSKSMSSMSKAIDSLTKGISGFAKNSKDTKALISFLDDMSSDKHVAQWSSDKFTKSMNNIVKLGTAIGDISKNLALSTPLLIIGIPGALLLIPTLALLSIAFNFLSSTSIGVFIGAWALKQIGKAMIKFAVSLGLAALAISINPMCLLMPVIFVGFVMLFTGLVKIVGTAGIVKFKMLTGAVTEIGLAMIAMSAAVLLAGMTTLESWGKFALMVGALFVIVKLFGGKKMQSEGSIAALMLLELCGAMALCAISMLIMTTVSWSGVLKGLVVLAALAGVCVVLGRMKSKIQQGAGAIIAMGVAVLLIAISLKKFENASWETLGKIGVIILGLTVVLITLAIPYISGGILIGAVTMLTMGLALLSIGLALKTFQDLSIDFDNMIVIAKSILLMGLSVGALGLISPFVLLGSAVGVLMSGSLLAIGLALQVLAETVTDPKNTVFICAQILICGVTIGGLGLISHLVLLGSAVGVILGGSLWVMGKALAKIGLTDGLDFKKIGKIGTTIYSFAGIMAGLSLGCGLIIAGAGTALGIGMALISIAKGLSEFKNIDLDGVIGDDPKETKIYTVIHSLLEPFCEIGRNATGNSVVGRFIASVFPVDTDLEIGLRSVQGIGGALAEVAKGVKEWANLTYTDEDGNEHSLVMEDMTQVQVNIVSMVSALCDVIAAIGRNEEITGDDGGWFSDSWFKKGKEVLDGNFASISDIAKVIKDFSSLKYKDPNDPSKTVALKDTDFKKTAEGIKDMINAMGHVIAEIGEDPDLQSNSSLKKIFKGETNFQKGIGVINRMAGGIKDLAGVCSGVTETFKLMSSQSDLESHIKKMLYALVNVVNSSYWEDGDGNIHDNWNFDKEKLDAMKQVKNVLVEVSNKGNDIKKAGEGMIKVAEGLQKSVDVINSIQDAKLKTAKEFFETLIEYDKHEVEIIERKAAQVNSILEGGSNYDGNDKAPSSSFSSNKNDSKSNNKETKLDPKSSDFMAVVAQLADTVNALSQTVQDISDRLNGTIKVKPSNSKYSWE